MLTTCFTLAVALAANPILATHDGTVEKDAIAWQSRVLVQGPARLLLRRPLPPALAVEVHGAGAERDVTGALTALVVSETGRVLVDVAIREPMLHGDVALHPPLVEGIERISLLGEGVRFRPDSALGFEQRIGMFATADVDRSGRAALEAAFPSPRNKPNTPPLWLAQSSPSELRAHGLTGSLARHTSITLIVATLGLAALCVLSLLGGVRVLRHKAASERADRLIDAEWRDVVNKSSA